jgi:hypothetical protein
MCPSSDWGFDESIDEQNSRAAEAREEDRRKADAEHDEKNKGGWGPFRSFSEWGKPSSSPEPESSGGFNTHAPGNNPPREEDPF